MPIEQTKETLFAHWRFIYIYIYIYKAPMRNACVKHNDFFVLEKVVRWP